jgi:hypothetical protein
MKNKNLFIVLFSIIILCACSPYIPLTKNLINENNLTVTDLKLLQFYSEDAEITYKGADILKKSEGIKEGDLFKGQQIERNFIIIPHRTEGAINNVILDDYGFPKKVLVKYDKDIPALTYELSTTSGVGDFDAYYLKDNEITVKDAVYKNKVGFNTKVYVSSEELDKLIENRKIAKGIKVQGTKLKSKSEVKEGK